MSLSAKIRRAPLRLVTGAYILNSGVGKLGADDDAAKKLHGFSSGTYPFLAKVQPKLYAKGLGVGEIAIGTVILLPFVSPVVAGAALVGFSGALLNVYWQTPGMHEEDSPRPTQQGSAIAKDVWMLGIGTGLIADGLLEPAHDKKVELGATVSEKRAEKSRRAKRKAAKAGAKAAAKASAKASKSSNSDYLAQARDTALTLQAVAGKRARKAAKEARKAAAKAQKRAVQAADVAGHRLAEVRSDHGSDAVDKAVDTAKQARGAARALADEYGPVAAAKAKQARDAAHTLADEYGPVAVDRVKQARQAAQDLGTKARERVAG